MKQLTTCFPLFFGLALIATALTACKTTSTTESTHAYTVAGIYGDARCFEGESDVAHTLKFGARIPEGEVIQTASGIGNVVMLVPNESLITPDRTNPRPYDYSDKVIVYENCVLKVDRLKAKTVRAKKIRDTRLVLMAGSVFCDVGLTWPTDEDSFWKPGQSGPAIKSLQPQPNAPHFEIGAGNMIIHAEHAVFFLSRAGIVRVLDGAVALEFSDSPMTKDVFAGQQYDSAKGKAAEFDARRPEFILPYWNWLRPRVGMPHGFSVPRRPF